MTLAVSRWLARLRCASVSARVRSTRPPTRAWRRSRPRGSDRSARPHRHPSGLNGFAGALETRDAGAVGTATRWYRATRPVIAGEEPSPTVRLAWASDFTANSGNHLDMSRWSAINADLTVNLGRVPVGEWTGVATRAWYASDGIGHARADLFDTEGLVGTCTASLLVDEVAAPYTSPEDVVGRAS